MNKKVIVFLALLVTWPAAAGAKDRIITLQVESAINPVVAEYLTEEIQQANLDQEELVVIQMDTPGGLDTSMRQIIKAILSSRVPVVTYVAPSGSRAASAGTFITIASHVAAMAPGTNIGAAHPVSLMGGGGEDKQSKTMEEKVTQDAAAYIRSLAEKRGRNAQWAELAVVKSVSISAEEAKRLVVIDLVANTLDALLLAIDGRKIEMDFGTITLSTEGKTIVHRDMNKRQKFLNIISNPNVAYVLMMLGLVGLYFELSNPGLILPGVIGGISLILALYAMQTLPINYAGLLLILLGVILFIGELNVVSSGILAVGGTLSILLGSVMLIDSPDPAMQISRTVLIPTLGFSVALSIGVVYLATQSHRRKIISGAEGLIGEKGVVKDELNPRGRVTVHGEVWNAECEGTIPAEQEVIVLGIEGLRLKVAPFSEARPVKKA